MFKQVYEHNDWGTIYYNFVRGGMATWREKEPLLSEGKILSLKFKDGSITRKKIVAKPKTSHISDHGHEYDVATKQLGIYEKVRGDKVFISLDKLKVEIKKE